MDQEDGSTRNSNLIGPVDDDLPVQAQEVEENISRTNEKNEQLCKENQLFYYKVESLKDDYQELEEKYNRLQRDFIKKSHVSGLSCYKFFF